MTTDTSPRSASPTDAEHATTDEIATRRGDFTTDARGDGLDRLRAGLVCGFVPVGRVRPLLDVACRHGYVAVSLTPALRVYQSLAGSR